MENKIVKADYLTRFDLGYQFHSKLEEKIEEYAHALDMENYRAEQSKNKAHIPVDFNDISDVIDPKEIEVMVDTYYKEFCKFLEEKKTEVLRQKKAGTFVSKVREGIYPSDAEGD